MAGHQQGSVRTALVSVVAVGAALFWGAGRLALVSPFQTKADRVAASTARAGAADGPEGAWLAATVAGASLVAYEVDGGDAVVTVEAAGTRAVGRARLRVNPAVAQGGSRQGLSASMLGALARADQVFGRPVPITSGLRSTQRQTELYAARASNPYPVAPPGSSRHESGQAIDVPVDVAAILALASDRTGLCQPYPDNDPVHFELCR